MGHHASPELVKWRAYGAVGDSSRGWDAVSQALDFASPNFRDGLPVQTDEVTRYAGADLVTCSNTRTGRPQWPAAPSWCHSPASADDISSPERWGWKVVSRHADPVTTPHPDGPHGILRQHGAALTAACVCVSASEDQQPISLDSDSRATTR